MPDYIFVGVEPTFISPMETATVEEDEEECVV